MIEDLADPRRSEPSFVLGERTMLEAWLEFHRTTLILKCEGLPDNLRKLQPVSTSCLSLHGLVRHAAEGERNWSQRNLLAIEEYARHNGYADILRELVDGRVGW